MPSTHRIGNIATIRFVILLPPSLFHEDCTVRCKNTSRRRFFFLNSRLLSLIPSVPMPVSASQFSRIVEKQSRGNSSSTVVRTYGRIKAVGGTNFHVGLATALRVVVPRKGQAFNIRHVTMVHWPRCGEPSRDLPVSSRPSRRFATLSLRLFEGETSCVHSQLHPRSPGQECFP